MDPRVFVAAGAAAVIAATGLGTLIRALRARRARLVADRTTAELQTVFEDAGDRIERAAAAAREGDRARAWSGLARALVFPPEGASREELAAVDDLNDGALLLYRFLLRETVEAGVEDAIELERRIELARASGEPLEVRFLADLRDRAERRAAALDALEKAAEEAFGDSPTPGSDEVFIGSSSMGVAS